MCTPTIIDTNLASLVEQERSTTEKLDPIVLMTIIHYEELWFAGVTR